MYDYIGFSALDSFPTDITDIIYKTIIKRNFLNHLVITSSPYYISSSGLLYN